MRFRKAVYGVLVVVTVVGAFWIPSATAGAASDPGAASDFVGRTNGLRASLGLPSLSVNGTLVAKAQAWAEHMAAVGDISHSNLSDGAPSEWMRLGENVGRGPSVDAIHNALVNSPEHYRNLTDPGFRYVGVGVVNANGTFFVSEVFMESASQPAPSTSAPAAGTSSPGRPRSAHSAPAAVPAPPPPPPPVWLPLAVVPGALKFEGWMPNSTRPTRIPSHRHHREHHHGNDDRRGSRLSADRTYSQGPYRIF